MRLQLDSPDIDLHPFDERGSVSRMPCEISHWSGVLARVLFVTMLGSSSSNACLGPSFCISMLPTILNNIKRRDDLLSLNVPPTSMVCSHTVAEGFCNFASYW